MRKSVILALTLLAALLFKPNAASAALEEDLQLSTYPDSIDLAVGEEAEVFLITHNQTDQVLSVNSIQVVPVEGLSIAVQPEGGVELPPQSDRIWNVRIRCESEITSDQVVHFRLDYQSGEASRSAFASLTVHAVQPLPANQVAELAIDTATSPLSQQRNGWAYLTLTNRSNQPIQVQSIQTSGPGFIDFGNSFQAPVELPAHDSLVLPIELRVTGAVQPGSYMLFYRIPITQEQQGVTRSYDLVQKQTITVGVLGESELLAAFQIPSLLLLPGMLTVITIGMWHKFLRKNGQKDEFPLKFKDEAFWLVSITFSFVIAWAYPLLTELLLKSRRDYLYGYGIEDIALIWLFGIVLGVMLSIAAGVVLGLRNWYKAYRQSSMIPTRGDDPQTLLQKLDRQGLKIGLEKVRLKAGRLMFVLYGDDEARETCWMCQGLTISYPQDNDELGQAIVAQLRVDGDPKTLLELAEQAKVSFGRVSPPEEIPVSEIEERLGPQVFVMLKAGRH
jgi:hypothetical protein